MYIEYEPYVPSGTTQDLEAVKTITTGDKENQEYVRFLIDAKTFKHFIEIENSICDNIIFYFTKKGLTIKAADPAHVAMIIQEIPSLVFQKYEISQDIKIGVDLDRLSDVLKNIKKEDIFKLEYNPEMGEYLFISINFFTHKIPLINNDNIPDSTAPVLDLPASFEYNLKDFYDFIKKAGACSDHIKITVNAEGLNLFAASNLQEINMTIPTEFLSLHVAQGTFVSMFSIDYLNMIVKKLKTHFTTGIFQIGNEKPLQLTCSNKFKTMILLAPRIESE